jgi:hypothetical protein
MPGHAAQGRHPTAFKRVDSTGGTVPDRGIPEIRLKIRRVGNRFRRLSVLERPLLLGAIELPQIIDASSRCACAWLLDLDVTPGPRAVGCSPPGVVAPAAAVAPPPAAAGCGRWGGGLCRFGRLLGGLAQLADLVPEAVQFLVVLAQAGQFLRGHGLALRLSGFALFFQGLDGLPQGRDFLSLLTFSRG